MGWRASFGATVTTVVVLFGGYLVADAYDVVPGMLTTAPAPAPPEPFPSAPGATTGTMSEPALSGLPEDAPVPDRQAVGRLVTDLTKTEQLGRRVGVLVTDPATGDALGGAAPDRPMVPASTQKVLTAIAAMAGPGGDATLPTTAVLDGDDHVVLVGGGDMMLAAGAGDPDLVNGRAGLGDLADQVVDQVGLAGRTTVTLSLDDTLFTGPAMAPAIPEEWIKGYIAPVSAVAVDVARRTDGEYAPRHTDPGLHAAKRFAAALEKRGITVRGDVGRAAAPSSAREIARVESAPLREVVAYLLQRSDNTITEVVGRVVALDAGLPGSLDGARKAVIAQVEDLGVDLEGARLVDLSGLGKGSRMTPRQLAEALELVVHPEHPALREVARGLPVAGLSGTLGDRYPKDNPGRGYVSAKTGSLPDVRGLAGTVVTADDRLLVVVAMADRIEETWGATDHLDDFTGALAACGCRAGG